MEATTSVMVYVIFWWLTLLMVLPFGVQNREESGADEGVEGEEPGAPAKPQLLKKMLITTLLSAIAFAIFYAAMNNGWLALDEYELKR